MAEIVVLGGGFGGLETVTQLMKSIGPVHRVTLVEKRDRFYVGLAKLWVVAGARTEAECYTDMSLISRKGVELVREEVTQIDTASKKVFTTSKALGYDFLVVALGAIPSANLVKGSVYAHNLYDITQGEEIHREIENLENGRISIVVAKPPYKCPPAPYEAAFLIEAMLRKLGKKEVEVHLYIPEPRPLGLLGKAVGEWMVNTLKEKGIHLHSEAKLLEITKDSIQFDIGEFQSGITLVVPPHVVPEVVRSSGLADGDWVSVDKQILTTKVDNVYAIGDCAGVRLSNGMLLPKAGVIAEAEGRVVAKNILAALNGSPTEKFDGHGYCFIELGDGKATTLEADFFAEPEPKATYPAPPSAEYEQKKFDFEKERIAKWFH